MIAVDKDVLFQMFSEFIEKATGGTKQVDVVKSLDDEKHLATWIVLSPDEVDLHGDTYTADEVEAACHNYNINCMKANLEHLLMVDNNEAFVVESYINPSEFKLDDTLVKKGAWLQTWKIPDEYIWKGVKEGHYTGLSIQCLANTEDLT